MPQMNYFSKGRFQIIVKLSNKKRSWKMEVASRIVAIFDVFDSLTCPDNHENSPSRCTLDPRLKHRSLLSGSQGKVLFERLSDIETS